MRKRGNDFQWLSSAGLGLLVLLILGGAESCLKGHRGSEKSDVAAIAALEERVFAAEGAGDLAAWLNCYAETAALFPPDATAIRGKPAIEKWAEPFFDQYELTETSDEREIIVSGDWGFIRAHWTWKLVPRGGGDPKIETGNSIWIVGREADKQWRITHAIWNRDSAQ